MRMTGEQDGGTGFVRRVTALLLCCAMVMTALPTAAWAAASEAAAGRSQQQIVNLLLRDRTERGAVEEIIGELRTLNDESARNDSRTLTLDGGSVTLEPNYAGSYYRQLLTLGAELLAEMQAHDRAYADAKAKNALTEAQWNGALAEFMKNRTGRELWRLRNDPAYFNGKSADAAGQITRASGFWLTLGDLRVYAAGTEAVSLAGTGLEDCMNELRGETPYYVFSTAHADFWAQYDAEQSAVAQSAAYQDHAWWMVQSDGEQEAALKSAAESYVRAHTAQEVQAWIGELGAGTPQVMLDGHTVALSPSETARYIAALNDALARGLALTEAQQSRNVTENTYLLRVQTGVNPGACVYYFGVGYLDDRGVERTEYIFPEDGVLERSYQFASAFGSTEERSALIRRATGYDVAGQQTGSVPLTAGSVDDYIFRPHYTVAQVTRIEVYLHGSVFIDPERYPSAKEGQWSCRALDLYAIDRINGYDTVGYVSDDYFLSFEGELLVYMKDSSYEFQTSDQQDRLFILGEQSPMGGPKLRFPDEDDPMRKYSSTSDTYFFKFDFADVYGAGIEALAAHCGDGQMLADVTEAMTLDIDYRDVYGKTRTVKLPLVAGMLTWLASHPELTRGIAVYDSGSSINFGVIGIAQQGESLMCPCVLPDFTEFISIDLMVGAQAEAEAGLRRANENTGVAARKRMLGNESIRLTGVQVYRGEVAVSAPSGASLQGMTVDSREQPVLSYSSPDAQGLQIQGQSQRSELSYLLRPDAGGTGRQRTEGDRYLVIITTDDMERAATTEELSLVIGYLSTSGETRETEPISLREAAQEFYGYWPTNDGGDGCYREAVSAGGRLVMSFRASDVNTFRSATLSIKAGAADEWQMKDFRILSVPELGARTAEWKNSSFSDRVFSRAFDESDRRVVARYPNGSEMDDENSGKLYLSGAYPSRTIEFGESSRSVISEHNAIDWREVRYSLTQKQAEQDLGFARASLEYQVSVKVAGSSEDAFSDDSGSKNLFYFKLIFAEGSSGYVLANQQLSSDGFRAGCTETFRIFTNEDYGNLTAVSIVPEDNSGSDNQDPFDKLNVESIKVTCVSGGGLSRSWMVGSVGWVGMVGYYDPHAESTASGRTGRSEAEMATVRPVTAQGYDVNLLFTLATEYGASGSSEQPMRGSVTATIHYEDVGGMDGSIDVDVIAAMYAYMGRTPEYYGTGAGLSTRLARSDPDTMLRPGHIDRFIVTMNDVVRITGIELHASAESRAVWNVGTLGVYQILTDGLLQLNVQNEFQRSSAVKLICTGSGPDTPSRLQLYAPTGGKALGGEQTVTMAMSEHRITVAEDAWTSSITREPVGQNDTLNVYIYMSEGEVNGVPEAGMGEYDLKGTLCWHSAEGGDRLYAASLGELNRVPSEHLFYQLGIKAAGMDSFRNMTLVASSRDLLSVHADHAVIQHVRSGVVIGTYYFPLRGTSLSYEHTCTPAAPPTERQTVRLFLTGGEEPQSVLPEINDLAVSIRYRTVNDRAVGGSTAETTYNSRNIFLSDLQTEDGNQKYTQLGAHQMVELAFDEAFVDEITGITVSSMGNLKLTLSAATAAAYTLTDAWSDEWTLADWKSFSDEQALSIAPYVVRPSAGTVTPIRVTLTTCSSARVIRAGVDTGECPPIRMALTYYDSLDGGERTLEIGDLRDYLVRGGFRADDGGSAEAVVELMPENVAEIRSIRLEPYAPNGAGEVLWGLEKVGYEAEFGGTMRRETRTVGETGADGTAAGLLLSEGTPAVINLATIAVKVRTESFNETTRQNITHNSAYNGTVDAAMAAGGSMTLTPTVVGALDGYGYIVRAIRASGVEIAHFLVRMQDGLLSVSEVFDGDDTGARRSLLGAAVTAEDGSAARIVHRSGSEEYTFLVRSDGGAVYFIPPEAEEELLYRVTLASEESPETVCGVNITVEAAQPKVELPEEPSGTGEPAVEPMLPEETGTEGSEEPAPEEPDEAAEE